MKFRSTVLHTFARTKMAQIDFARWLRTFTFVSERHEHMTDWMTDRTGGLLAGSESFETAGTIATAVRDHLISLGFRDFEGERSLDGAALCGWSDKLRCEVTIDVGFHCLDEDDEDTETDVSD
jgi:hypothetical protein